MGADPHTCATCGGWDGGNHSCPGEPSDRLDEHDMELALLSGRIEALEAAHPPIQIGLHSLDPDAQHELYELARHLKTDVTSALRYAIHRGLQTFTGSVTYVRAETPNASGDKT